MGERGGGERGGGEREGGEGKRESEWKRESRRWKAGGRKIEGNMNLNKSTHAFIHAQFLSGILYSMMFLCMALP